MPEFSIKIATAHMWKQPHVGIYGHFANTPSAPSTPFDPRWNLHVPVVTYHTLKGTSVDEIVEQMVPLCLKEYGMYEQMCRLAFSAIDRGAPLHEDRVTEDLLKTKISNPMTPEAVCFTYNAFTSSSSYESLVHFDDLDPQFGREARAFQTWIELSELWKQLQEGDWLSIGCFEDLPHLKSHLQEFEEIDPRLKRVEFQYGAQEY